MTQVLAVDDSPTNLLLIQIILESAGLTPDLASNGLEALKMVQTKHYDLIFLDVLMPLIDGIETVRLIRQVQMEAPPFIALVTSADPKECQQMLKDQTVDGIISKGSDYTSFQQAVLNILKQIGVS